MSWLTTEALSRVLESLLRAELQQIRHRTGLTPSPGLESTPWPASLALGEEGSPALGCDSIELLWLSAAVNEMFCLYDAHVEASLLAARTFGDWLDIVERGWNAAGHRVTFSTSGSSGVPKRCTHERASLEREIEFLAGRLAGTSRIVSLASPHHIYGFLFTAMLPSRMGLPVLAADTFSAGALARELSSGDLLISFPTRWSWLARSIPRWPQGIHGITSTAPCPEDLKATLTGNGLQSFIEVYGSSETAGVGLRSFPETRYTLMPFWSWADRREDAPCIQDHEGHTMTLQDRLDIAPDGTFTVKTRVDGAVQVAGMNVFPSRLEELLRSVPGVAEASVRLSTDVGSQRLKAFIVPEAHTSESALADTLELWAMAFTPPERIRSFTFGPDLPRNPLGKLADWDEAVQTGVGS